MHLLQNLRKLYGEYNRTANGCCGIGYTLGRIYTHHSHKMRENQCQRNKQKDFTEQGYKNRHLGLTQCHEHILTGTLKPENSHPGKKYGHYIFNRGYETFISGKGR